MRVSVSVVFLIPLLVAGAVLILGGVRRWPAIVDPDENRWYANPLAMMKIMVGARAMPWACIAYGVVVLAIAAFIFSRYVEFS
jgi:hypothetical protein